MSAPSTPTRLSLSQPPLPPPSPKSPVPVAGPSQSAARSRNSPSRPNFSTSSTHASGILPSASFFRPSKPNHSTPTRRPTSVGSEDGLPPAQDQDLFQMSSLSKQVSISSDAHGRGNSESVHDETQFSRKRGKKGHEPLLPLVNRPSMSRETSNTSKGAKAIVRNSLDRVFNLGRGMSVDSLHKPSQSHSQRVQSATEDLSAVDAHGFEGKFMDEDAGIYEGNRQSYSRRKESSDIEHAPGLGIPQGPSSPRSPSVHSEWSFIAEPRSAKQALWDQPWSHPETKGVVRNYQRHPSSNRFWLQGRMLSGGDSPWAFVASFTTLVVITGLWFGATAPWWWNNKSPAVAIVAAYFALLTITSMLTTAFSDPGILPRNLDPDPPYPSGSPSDGSPKAPMPRDLKVRSDVVRVKYCHTCLTYRPPRSSHCKMCDNCVDGCDHHCQWVNNCVGHRNYTTFFVLLSSATIATLLIIITSALHLYFMTVQDGLNFRQALAKAPGSAVVFLLSILVVWPVGALLTYHVRLLFKNVTTIEQLRNQGYNDEVPPNPFSHGSPWRNLVAVLCRPPGYSWLDFHAIATKDQRKVNPANRDEMDGVAFAD